MRGDGFCILNAISTSFLMDLMKIITVSKMKQKITEYLIKNGKKYTQWYSGTLDNLVYDATEFFSTGNYNHDILTSC